MFQKAKRESAKVKAERLEAEATHLRSELVAARRDNEVLRGQLTFWHEHSRGLENKVQMLMREQLNILEAFRAGMPNEAEYLALIRQSRDAFDAAESDRPGIAALIASISLAGTQQVEVIGELIPSLKPMLAAITTKALPERPRAQMLGVSGEAQPRMLR